MNQPATIQQHDMPQWLWDLLQRRGIESIDDLHYPLSRLLPPDGMAGLSEAVPLLVNALENNKSIVIAGDYDVDGISGCALAVQALKAFGCMQVAHSIPNRFEQGYGLDVSVVEQLHNDGHDLIITVDNGISSHDAITRARELGMEVIITDHHIPKHKLPPAHAIVNPNLTHCQFPSKNLAGAGVIFYLLLALRSALRQRNWFLFRRIREPVMASYLPLVALATIADMTPLDLNNRILVHNGLVRIRNGRMPAGIRALSVVGNVTIKHCTSRDLAFSVAPPLNAAGRLGTMDLALDCLLSTNLNMAFTITRELQAINAERKELQLNMTNEAKAIVDEDASPLPELLVLQKDDWHQGITGIVASNIKDMFHKSCIILTAISDTMLKGSGRAENNLNLSGFLNFLDQTYPGTFAAVGGHARAVGMTIARDQLPTFRKLVQRHVDEFIDEHVPPEQNDGSLPTSEVTLESARLIEQLTPWGVGFDEPLFCDTFSILEQSVFCKKHLRLQLMRDNQVFDAVCFSVNTSLWPNPEAEQIRVLYSLNANRFDKKESLQLIIRNIEVL